METKTDRTYRLAYAYVVDNKELLSESEFRKITGSLRQRNPRLFSEMWDQVTLALQGGGEFEYPRHINLERTRFFYQLYSFFRKNEFLEGKLLPSEKDRHAETMRKFFESEQHCKLTNYSVELGSLLEGSGMKNLLSRVSAEIEHLFPEQTLKDFFDLSDIPQELSAYNLIQDYPDVICNYMLFSSFHKGENLITSGATSHSPRRRSTPYTKVCKRLWINPCLLSAFNSFFKRKRTLNDRVSTVNRVTTVRKTWKVDRTIACEPAGNIIYQKAADYFLKDRLLKWGIDLTDQTKNKELARIGSINGSFATIDLSSASDSLSTRLVEAVLPPWLFRALSLSRSPFGSVDGKVIKYEKFASMGNALTFSLETLIFGAIVRAVLRCNGVVSPSEYAVYGDDIIVRTEHANEVIDALKMLGFTTNSEKTFTTGLFRESCGGNYYRGVDITPFTLKHWSNKMDSCLIVNRMIRISNPSGLVSSYLSSIIEKEKLPIGPPTFDERSHVHCDVHTAYLGKHLRNSTRKDPSAPVYQVQTFRVLQEKSKSIRNRSMRGYSLWLLYYQNGSGPRADFSTGWEPEGVSRVSSRLAQAGSVIRSVWVPWSLSSIVRFERFKERVASTYSPDHLFGWSDYFAKFSK